MTDLELYRGLLRNYFPAFIQRSFRQLNPGIKYFHNWHIDVIAAALEDCVQGKETRLVLTQPPRSLKSHIASIALPAYYLGRNPAGRIICASYGQDLADKFARDCRNIMSSVWFRGAFPARLSRTKNSIEEFVTTQNGYRLATSVGGPLTGRGADLIIIDDPMKPEEALSDARRKSVNDWFRHSLYSRLDDKLIGTIIIIMQRLHEDDLVASVLEQEAFKVISLPAIAEHDETYEIEMLFGTRRFCRRAGEALHTAREPKSVLDGIRQTIGEYNFAAQYQQSPAPLGGGMVKESWFKFYADDELTSPFDQVIQSWDSANKIEELNDYSVCTTWGIKGPRCYLINLYRKRVEYPDLKRAVRDQASMFGATAILIEDKASGTQLAQELIREGLHTVKLIKPVGDKKMRLNAQTATIENGFVYLPRQACWLSEYVSEMTTFPRSKYDDQVDSTSQALAFINQTQPCGWRAWVRMENVLRLYRNGMSAAEIAENTQSPLTDVEVWIAEEKELETKRPKIIHRIPDFGSREV